MGTSVRAVTILQVIFVINYSYLGKYDVIATGIDVAWVGISAQITEEIISTDFDVKEDVVIVPKDKVLALSEIFFTTIKDDEGMAQSLPGQ